MSKKFERDLNTDGHQKLFNIHDILFEEDYRNNLFLFLLIQLYKKFSSYIWN